MNVIRVGETVLIGGWFVSESPITGTVVGVMIDGQDMSHVQYRVAWWNGAARVCEWIEAAEIHRNDETARQQIGFYVAFEA